MDKVSIYHQLKDLFEIMKKEKDENNEEIIEILKGINFRELIPYYLEEKLDDMDLMTIRKIIEITQYLYNNTSIESPIMDEDYDKLYQLMLDNGMADIVGSTFNNQGKKLRYHSYPDLRGTLDKVHFVLNVDKKDDNRRSIEDWITSIENILHEPVTDDDRFKILLQPKHDGLSVIHECDKDGNIIYSLTRGDVEKNLAIDISEMFVDIFDFSKYSNGKDKFGIKSEVVMTRENFEKFCKEQTKYNSPRSAVSAILNEKELRPELAIYLTIMPLRIQYEGREPEIIIGGYEEECILSNYIELRYKIQAINEKVREDGLWTDGVVLYLEDKDIQKRLGRVGAINRYEVAYKFPAEEKKTTLIDVDFAIGLGGNVTPVAKFNPVIMRGNEIKSASLGSIDRFRSLDLHKGDEVIIKYEIIPYLEVDARCKRNKDGEKFKIPTHCKYCGCRLEEDPLLKCINDECSSRVIGNVVNYINKMRIENISIGIVTTLFDNGIIKGIESLYTLNDHKEEIINLPGFGIKTFDNIIKGIESKKDVFAFELLGALGIPGIGEKTFKKVLNIMTLDELLDYCKENKLPMFLLGIPGFQEKTCLKIQRGIISKLKLIYFLLDTLNIKDYKAKPTKGQICFSKVRDYAFENRLIEEGYEVSESLNKNTKLLIVPSLDASSSKIEKAKKYGIGIMTLDEAYKKI